MELHIYILILIAANIGYLIRVNLPGDIKWKDQKKGLIIGNILLVIGFLLLYFFDN